MSADYRQQIKAAILDPDHFVKAVFHGRQRQQIVPWVQVTAQPVVIKGRKLLRFSYFDGRQDVTKNYDPAQAAEALDQLLSFAFKNIHVTGTAGGLHVQFTKKGRALVHHHPPADQPEELALAHDRRKPAILPADQPDAFLQAVGIMTQDGQVRADKRGKFHQINEFLRLVEQTGALERIDADPLCVADLGCGNAYLTFAFYHYLNHIRGRRAVLTGVDSNARVLQNHAAKAADLGWEEIDFAVSRIIDFQPPAPPHIVIALHACDTATDEALAQAVRWESRLIVSAPCCHHHLQAQLSQGEPPEPFGPVMFHGILRERLGDILTDSFRALILRLMGYRAGVIEFVSSEHTNKNLMIRAVRTGAPAEPELIAQYQALKAFWGVTPYLETLLGEDLRRVIA